MVRGLAGGVGIALVAASVMLHAHNGPPFPIVSDQPAGPYLVSIWTDPDTTDDGSSGGQFWVRLESQAKAVAIPDHTRAMVSVSPADRTASELHASASPVRGDAANQFAALVLDHEGRFAVRVSIDGPLGAALVDSTVDATYDLRPSPFMLAVYLAPFVLMGLLWGRLFIRRRTMAGQAGARTARRPS